MHPELEPVASAPSSEAAGTGPAGVLAASALVSAVDALIQVDEVTDAEYYAGDLFRRRFGGDPPDYPRHFVAFYKAARNAFVVVGYIHYTTFEDIGLVGGMIEDERALFRMPAPHQAVVRNAGGIATKLFRDTFGRFGNLPALWAHVGDREARQIFLRAGFAAVDDPYIMVRWNREMSGAEQAARIAHVRSLGPF